MYFARKRFCFDAFDGKTIMSAYFDFPTDGEGIRFEYLSAFVKGCFEFVAGKLCDTVKNNYLSEYNNRGYFARYHYELKINETFAEDELYSYLISVFLKCGTNIVSYNVSSVVFYRETIIPPKLICKRKSNAVILNAEGITCSAEYSDGHILIEKLNDKKFCIMK